MSVYLHKVSGLYHYDFQSDGNRYYGPTGTSNKRAAEECERRKRREAAEGKLDEKSQMILSEACLRYWNEHGSRLGSAKDVKRRLQTVVDMIGPTTRLIDITTSMVSDAIEKRRGTPFTRSRKKGAKKYLISNTTANRDMISTLRPVLRRASKRWGITGLPDIDWGELTLEEPKPKPKEFTDTEMDGIRAQVRPHWHDAITFMERYGVRLSELFFPLAALDIEDRESARVTLRNRKGGADHIIPLRPDDAAWLAARMGRAKAAKLDTVWFRELKSGKLKPLSYWGTQSAVDRAMDTVGLRASKNATGPHSLRHNAGMKIMRESGNLRVAQKLLGHASIKSTLVYAHATEDDVKTALMGLSRNSPEAVGTRAKKRK